MLFEAHFHTQEQGSMQGSKTGMVELFDTSLRDGLQQPNLDISVPNAVGLLQRMGEFGVHYAEIGFAGANQFVGDLASALHTVDTGAMKLALFGRTRGRGSKVQEWSDAQIMVRHKERIPVAVVVVKSRLLDVAKSLETTPEENLLMARETISYLHDNGLEVIVDLEHALDAFCGRRENGELCDPDFTKRSQEYFHQMVAQCVEQKVSRMIACDTTGGASPEEVAQLFTGLTHAHPDARFGFHGHTDRGLGIANTRAAILAGAVQVQGTILGTGERCGNVNLTTVIGSMQLRGEAEFVALEALAGLTGRLTRLSRWRHLTAFPSSGRGPSGHGLECMAAARAKTPEPTCGAIPPGSAPARASGSTPSRDGPISFCCRSRSAFRSTQRKRRPCSTPTRR
jgi:2-isopropylmalate synthase